MNYFLLFLLFLSLPNDVDAFTLASEPTVREVQAETVRQLGFDETDMEGLGKRARWAAALPRFEAGFQRDLKDVVRLNTRDSVSVSGGNVFVGPDENNFDQNFDQGTSFQVKAVWYLDDLVFNRDSLAVSSEKRDWVREKNKALQDVTEAYFTRRRLLSELRGKTDPALLRERKKLLLDQATGTIDAYTGGWFSNHIDGGGGVP